VADRSRGASDIVAVGETRLLHGTAIALKGRAALIRGESGSGKSDLALRCLAQPPSDLISGQALLVADDQVRAEVRGGKVHLTCPETIKGLIEVRGLGIVAVPAQDEAELELLVDLVRPEEIERLPDPAATAEIMGVQVRHLALAPFEASAPLKLLLALQGAAGAGRGS